MAGSNVLLSNGIPSSTCGSADILIVGHFGMSTLWLIFHGLLRSITNSYCQWILLVRTAISGLSRKEWSFSAPFLLDRNQRARYPPCFCSFPTMVYDSALLRDRAYHDITAALANLAELRTLCECTWSTYKSFGRRWSHIGVLVERFPWRERRQQPWGNNNYRFYNRCQCRS